MIQVIAEAGQCAAGDINEAVTMARAAAQAGAAGFKVQLLTPERIASPGAAKYWDDNIATVDQQDAFTRAGIIPYDEWQPVVDTCAELGIEFIATPFDLDAVVALMQLGVRTVKIASGDITHRPLIEAVRTFAAHVILSTGASTPPEIDEALRWLHPVPTTLLACSLQYPTPLEHASLERIAILRHRYPHHRVGYSDHTTWPMTSLPAVVAGAEVLEKHFTIDTSGTDVPDQQMALTPDGLATYVRFAEKGRVMLGAHSWVHDGERAARLGARRSIVAARDIRRGQRFRAEDLDFLRPGDGIPPSWVDRVVGSEAVRDFARGERISL